MAGIEDVVRRLLPAKEPRKSAVLFHRRKAITTPGDYLVRVRLMADVPDQSIAWRIEGVVECKRELDGSETGCRVATDLRERLDHVLPDLLGDLGQLGRGQFSKIRRIVDRGQQRHVCHVLFVAFLSAGSDSLSWHVPLRTSLSAAAGIISDDR